MSVLHVVRSAQGILPLAILAAALASPLGAAPPAPPQGQFFAKKQYVPQPLPEFAQTKDKLPAPIYDEDPRCVAMYWKTWELAFKNFHAPAAGSGFVSQFIDAAFNQNIFLWDSCFMTMFCNYGHPLVPGIGTLDNFYAKQHADGEICREIVRATGQDFGPWVNSEHKSLLSRWGDLGGKGFSVKYVGREAPQPPPCLTLDSMNHPLMAWAELESVRITGDHSRLQMVYPPLVHYYRALEKYLRQGNGLYVTDWASMDNSPRNTPIAGGGAGVDISAEMVLFANQLAEIAELLDKKDEAAAFRGEAAELSRRINEKMWDPQRKFYFDLTPDGKQTGVKTVAAYWTLLAGVATTQQADALAAELTNPQSFGRRHRVPTCPADQEGFKSTGGYWQGSVWAPINTMVIRGLERYGKGELARQIAREDLLAVARVFQKTGTVWENYAPDSDRPGDRAKPDFVGWTGIVPILYFFEYGIGLRPDAPKNQLTWRLDSAQRCGCERFRFNGHTVSLLATPPQTQPGPTRISVDSDGPFQLRVEHGGRRTDFRVQAGSNRFSLP
jgi:hypothetical protein